MTVQITPDGRWYVQYYLNRKHIKEYFGHGDLSEARARAFQDSLDEKRGKVKVDPASISTIAVCQTYRKEHLLEDSTRRMDKYKFAVLWANLGEIPAEALTTKHLNDYLMARLKQGVKRATVKNEIARLKAAFSWAEDQDPPLILQNRIRRFRIGKTGERDVPLPPTTKEFKAILSHCLPHVFRAIMVARYCGMRPGPRELFAITWADVDWEDSLLRVPCAHKGGPVTRIVPIPKALLTHLLTWHQSDKEFLAAKTGDAVSLPELSIVHYFGRSVKSIKRAWAAAKKAAGVTRKIRPYDIRHAFTTQALRSGADLKATSEIIGHSRPDTTIREYQHVTTRDHRRVVDLAPEIFGGDGGTMPPSSSATKRNNKTKKSGETSQV
jgi:integrase